MFHVYVDNKQPNMFTMFELAIKFAKESGVFYWITNEEEIIYTQNDEIMELL